jgi:hypothetical protein
MKTMLAAAAAALLLAGCVQTGPMGGGFPAPGPVYQSGRSGDLAFQLYNSTPYTLMYFYASPPSTSSWEEDILGNSVLGSRGSVRVVIADGRRDCVYDMRMVFDNGSELVDQVDLCRTNSYTVGR